MTKQDSGPQYPSQVQQRPLSLDSGSVPGDNEQGPAWTSLPEDGKEVTGCGNHLTTLSRLGGGPLRETEHVKRPVRNSKVTRELESPLWSHPRGLCRQRELESWPSLDGAERDILGTAEPVMGAGTH